MATQSIKKGDRITYEKQIRFKGAETVTATVVAVTDKKILLDNGDQFFTFKGPSPK